MEASFRYGQPKTEKRVRFDDLRDVNKTREQNVKRAMEYLKNFVLANYGQDVWLRLNFSTFEAHGGLAEYMVAHHFVDGVPACGSDLIETILNSEFDVQKSIRMWLTDEKETIESVSEALNQIDDPAEFLYLNPFFWLCRECTLKYLSKANPQLRNKILSKGMGKRI